MTGTEEMERLERRDATPCVCGHPNVSHGYGAADGPAWPDGSRIGRGACGKRDVDDSIFEMCPCDVFVEAVAA